MGRIVIISGPPGAGKSTIARALTEQTAGPLGMHMHTDDLYAYIRKGFVEPWRPESQHQNITLMRAMAASAGVCASQGYDVCVDGIVGTWFLDPWRDLARAQDLDLRFVVLLPAEDEVVARATARTAPGAMSDAAVVRQMWQAFQAYPPPPGHVVDTTARSAADTVAELSERLALGDFMVK